MPYIKPEARARLEKDSTPRTAGELNYLVSRAAARYLKEHGESYTVINHIVRQFRRAHDCVDAGFVPPAAGTLAEEFWKLAKSYTSPTRDGISVDEEIFETIEEILGVLECAEHEFYRRVAVPYEDEKAWENGDVYEPRCKVQK